MLDCPGNLPCAAVMLSRDRSATSRSPAALVSIAKMRVAFVHLAVGHVGDRTITIYSRPDYDVLCPSAFRATTSFSALVI